ncbi:hypothetical protein J6590_051248 [Homalodisca vitripennis]|nr:hypothetical protein J6590_051248 [Homalodisca vitripennis]
MESSRSMASVGQKDIDLGSIRGPLIPPALHGRVVQYTDDTSVFVRAKSLVALAIGTTAAEEIYLIMRSPSDDNGWKIVRTADRMKCGGFNYKTFTVIVEVNVTARRGPSAIHLQCRESHIIESSLLPGFHSSQGKYCLAIFLPVFQQLTDSRFLRPIS